MKKIPFQEAVEILKGCLGIIINDENSPITYPDLSNIRDEDPSWSATYTDENGLIYIYEFKEEGNKEVEIKGGNMVWVDKYGSTEITILVKQDL